MHWIHLGQQRSRRNGHQCSKQSTPRSLWLQHCYCWPPQRVSSAACCGWTNTPAAHENTCISSCGCRFTYMYQAIRPSHSIKKRRRTLVELKLINVEAQTSTATTTCKQGKPQCVDAQGRNWRQCNADSKQNFTAPACRSLR